MLVHPAVFVDGRPATRQREQVILRRVAQRQGDIGVEITQVGEGLGYLLEEGGLCGGVGKLDCQNGDRPACEQVAALGAGKGQRGGLGLQIAPEQAQAGGGSGNVKCDRKGLLQTVALAILSHQPERYPGLRFGIYIQQPASQFFHGSLI